MKVVAMHWKSAITDHFNIQHSSAAHSSSVPFSDSPWLTTLIVGKNVARRVQSTRGVRRLSPANKMLCVVSRLPSYLVTRVDGFPYFQPTARGLEGTLLMAKLEREVTKMYG